MKLLLSAFMFLLVFALQSADSKSIILRSGKYKVSIDTGLAWTIRSISYDGVEIGKSSGYYGTVFAPESGKYIGAGHAEGGKETVRKIEFLCDSKLEEPKNGEIYAGEKLVLYKVSTFDKLLFQTRIELSPDGLVEQKRFIALEEQRVDLLYVNLFCWDFKTTEWCAMTVDEKFLSAFFDNDYSGNNRWHLRADVKWAAVYDTVPQCAMLIFYPYSIKGKAFKSAFWQVRDRYNKYYLQADLPAVCQAGYISRIYTSIVKGFIVNPENWRQLMKDEASRIPSCIRISLPDIQQECQLPDK